MPDKKNIGWKVINVYEATYIGEILIMLDDMGVTDTKCDESTFFNAMTGQILFDYAEEILESEKVWRGVEAHILRERQTVCHRGNVVYLRAEPFKSPLDYPESADELRNELRKYLHL